ncbi:MAG: carboxypeptidase-like regulatory domain-containing protein [Porphyromonadaceae bacterium]|nr:MAG: carboxypeptidase-like regulatory domain-containing protein [Porphyromonadaceae bacterium]
MRKFLILFSLLLSFSTGQLFPQSGSVTGVVADSLTGLPVANLSVFIPFTTTGTTTNAKGEYKLDRLPPGDYTLMFRHVTYRSYSKSITIESGKQLVLNLAVSENIYKIDEVVKFGKIPDWSWGYNLFKEYFLGDANEIKCTLRNPKDLKFYYDGDILTAYSRQPLEIINRHLGYRIIYYLDYFKFVENKNPGKNSVQGGYYAFSGSALYQDLPSKLRITASNWKLNREAEFKGSLRHFLACLYQEKLSENRYYLRKAYHGITDLQKQEKLASSMAKIKMAQMDSIFSWYPNEGKSGFLYFIPVEEFLILPEQITDGPGSGEKTAVLNEFLLVFSDFEKTIDLRDDWTSSLRIPKGTIIFDQEGNYRVPGDTLQWTNLDNTVRMRVMLPTDYVPKEDH